MIKLCPIALGRGVSSTLRFLRRLAAHAKSSSTGQARLQALSKDIRDDEVHAPQFVLCTTALRFSRSASLARTLM